MIDIKALKAQLILHEGKKHKPYTCTAGKLTIGIGRNLADVGVSEDEIDLMFDNDIGHVFYYLDNALPWWKGLSDVRQRVLADMCFNLGINRLLGFKNTLAFIKNGEYEKASDAMLQSKWAKQVGERAIRLARMMKTGND